MNVQELPLDLLAQVIYISHVLLRYLYIMLPIDVQDTNDPKNRVTQ